MSERELVVRAPEPTEQPFDAIVIGSGMSGLTSAVILGKEGMRVLVLEQHYRPGGFLHRFHRKGGISFDVGFHYLGSADRDRILGRYLSYCDVLDRLDLIPLDPHGYDELCFPDLRFVIPAGREPLRERLVESFPQERAAIGRYLAEADAICDGFGFYRLRSEQDLAHVGQWLGTPVGEYLDGITANPRLKAVLLGQNPLYGVEPARAPAGLHALVTDSFMHRPCTLRGGGDALARVMVERIGELGGTVRSRRRVTDILVDDQRRVRGVRTARGEEYRAPLVVSCAHPKVTLRMLPDGVLRRGFHRRLMAMEEGPSALSIFYTTSLDLSAYAGRNLYRFRDLNIDALYEPNRPDPGFVFVTVPTAREGTGSGGVHQVIALAMMRWQQVQRWQHTRTGARGDDYEAFKEAEADRLSELVYELLPELRGNIISREVATPLTVRDYTSSERGAAYGIHHCVEQSGRYGVRPVTRVRGLYLTGQSVLMPGVCGVTISAFHTCSIILGTEYLMNKVLSHG